VGNSAKVAVSHSVSVISVKYSSSTDAESTSSRPREDEEAIGNEGEAIKEAWEADSAFVAPSTSSEAPISREENSAFSPDQKENAPFAGNLHPTFDDSKRRNSSASPYEATTKAPPSNAGRKAEGIATPPATRSPKAISAAPPSLVTTVSPARSPLPQSGSTSSPETTARRKKNPSSASRDFGEKLHPRPTLSPPSSSLPSSSSPPSGLLVDGGAGSATPAKSDVRHSAPGGGDVDPLTLDYESDYDLYKEFNITQQYHEIAAK